MFVFGHVGLTIAAARAAERNVDLRWAAALALAPDILDKPVKWMFPVFVHHNTRNYGHTLLVSLAVFAGILLWTRRPKTALVLWGCYAGHFVFDAMWMPGNPAVLLWPLLGEFPRPVRGPLLSWLMVWYAAGEIAGLTVLVKLFRQNALGERGRLSSFLRTGRLA